MQCNGHQSMAGLTLILFALKLTPFINLESPVNLTYFVLWTLGGSRSTQRELIQAKGNICNLNT